MKTEPTLIQPRLLSVKQTAAYLNCSIWAVRSLAWDREVPFLKIGKRILFDRTDLDAFIEGRKTEAIA